MKKSIVLKVILFLCGIAFILAGGLAMLKPVAFTLRNGIDIAGNISLLNDYRGMGGLLFGSGVIIMLGVFISRMTFTSNVVAAVVYSTFVIGRSVSLLMDGMPAEGLVKATVVEGILGIAAVVALILFREKESPNAQ